MNRLTCEMCNGTDILKQDGFYVCQSCGTKYTIEEAKKMMIEGTVDVQGTVKVDNSALFEKYLANARRAKEKGDWEEVEKYYNLVEENSPRNIEAVFYSAYGKAMLSLSDADKFKREQKFKVLQKSISVIDDYYDASQSAELAKTILDIGNDIITMSGTGFVYNKTTKNNVTTDDSKETYVMFAKAELEFVSALENILKKDPKAQNIYRILIAFYKICIKNSYVSIETANNMRGRMQNAMDELKALDPSYVPEELPAERKNYGCLTAGIAFIIFGIVFLLINTGYFEIGGYIMLGLGAISMLGHFIANSSSKK